MRDKLKFVDIPSLLMVTVAVGAPLLALLV